METSEMLPISTIVCMWISLGFTVLLPILGIIICRIKAKGTMLVSLWGILSYGLGFCVYGLLWCVYVVIFSKGYDTTDLKESYYLILAMLAGIVATLWNYLFLKKLRKKRDGLGTALSFYSGFVLVTCYETLITQIGDLYWAMRYNQMGLEALTEGMATTKSQVVTERLYLISMNSSGMYLIKGLECLFYIPSYLALGYLLYQAVKRRKKWQSLLIILSVMIFHFGLVLPAQLVKSGTIDVSGKEVILAAITACLCILILMIHMKKKNRDGGSYDNRTSKRNL